MNSCEAKCHRRAQLYAFRCGLNNRPEALLALAQCPLDLLLVRDILRDFRGSHDTPGAILHGRNCKGNVEFSTVLAYADSFEMVDSLASLESLKNLCFLVPAVGRNDERNVPADRLLCGVPEHSPRTFIPAGDDAIQILADDRVVRGIHDRSQQS